MTHGKGRLHTGEAEMTHGNGRFHVSLVAIPDAMASPLSGLYDVLNCFELLGSFDDSVPKAAPFRVEIVAPERARIMTANVVFPFAAALAVQIGDIALGEQARAAYLASPGLPSNQITREMTRQLGLARHPSGAAAQQGLHHLWASWCHAKDCARCPCNPAGLLRTAYRQSRADTV